MCFLGVRSMAIQLRNKLVCLTLRFLINKWTGNLSANIVLPYYFCFNRSNFNLQHFVKVELSRMARFYPEDPKHGNCKSKSVSTKIKEKIRCNYLNISNVMDKAQKDEHIFKDCRRAITDTYGEMHTIII
jgi:hypothetical protein